MNSQKEQVVGSVFVSLFPLFAARKPNHLIKPPLHHPQNPHTIPNRHNQIPIMNPFLTLFLVFLALSQSVLSEDDVQCLRGIQRSFNQQSEILTWNFSNTTRGFICSFSGVTCWNDLENRVISLALRDLSLSGSIPSDIKYCESLQKLDLSGNNLSGSIPVDICTWLPYLVSLDLSKNQFTGEIPASLGNCTFLNTVLLSGNKLSGGIPSQLSNLGRLSKFSVADNQLSGSIPSGLSHFARTNFEGNDGLCGEPLSSCSGWK